MLPMLNALVLGIHHHTASTELITDRYLVGKGGTQITVTV